MRSRWLWAFGAIAVLAGALPGCHSSDTVGTPATPPQILAACADRDPLGRVYWGDLHVHTSWSLDSFTAANRNDPRDAYAFARGRKTLPINSGAGGTATAAIDRPLDFMAVTEHSEFLSATGECLLGSPGGEAACGEYLDQNSPGQTAIANQSGLLLTTPNPGDLTQCTGADNSAQCRAAARTTWQRLREITESAYDRCTFTTLHGYEWTAMTGGANLHRNVIFATDKVPELPLDYLRYPTPLQLWRGLDEQCVAAAGCEAITIPHNSNYSAGRMWETASDPESRAYMARYQILVEIFQHKGNSECLPGGGGEDPACDFEKSNGNLLAALFGNGGAAQDPVTAGPGYVRNGLARGLELEATSGQNPLDLGFVGGTDTHNATPGAVREETWAGHVAQQDDTPRRRLTGGPTFNPGGLTGVWAPQNTREDVFAALKRRETFATTGPRMVARFYSLGGLRRDEQAAPYCADPLFPKKLVDAGATPMGGHVTAGGAAPYFFVSVMKDEADLATIDIVKLSLDARGLGTVAVHAIPLRGAQTASGCVFWRDPSYSSRGPSLYYARVFQQPTWRWSHYDCKADPASCAAGRDSLDVPVQERAWTSPIFFRGAP